MNTPLDALEILVVGIGQLGKRSLLIGSTIASG
jgi:hypothetical protein